MGSDPSKQTLRSRLQQTAQMDWVAAALVLGAVTCLVLALQWGGNTKPWGSAAVIVPLVLGPVALAALIPWELYVMKERALVPTAIFSGGFKRASQVWSIVGFSFTVRFSMLILTVSKSTSSQLNLLEFSC